MVASTSSAWPCYLISEPNELFSEKFYLSWPSPYIILTWYYSHIFTQVWIIRSYLITSWMILNRTSNRVEFDPSQLSRNFRKIYLPNLFGTWRIFLLPLPLLEPTSVVIVHHCTSRQSPYFENTWLADFSRQHPVVRCITAELLVGPNFSLLLISHHCHALEPETYWFFSVGLLTHCLH